MVDKGIKDVESDEDDEYSNDITSEINQSNTNSSLNSDEVGEGDDNDEEDESSLSASTTPPTNTSKEEQDDINQTNTSSTNNIISTSTVTQQPQTPTKKLTITPNVPQRRTINKLTTKEIMAEDKKKKKEEDEEIVHKKKEIQKKRKKFELGEEIEASQAANISLADLVDTSIKDGKEMPSTLERRAEGKEDEPVRRKRAVAVVEDNEPTLEMDEEGKIIAVQKGPSGAVDYSSFFETGGLVNSNSFALKRDVARRWSTEETNKFYAALKRYGTDFSLIESVFGNRSRSQLKSKFKREERDHPGLIQDLLTTRMPIDIDEFNKDANRAKEKRRRAEDERRKEDDRLRQEEKEIADKEAQEDMAALREGRAPVVSSASTTIRRGRNEEVVLDRAQYLAQKQREAAIQAATQTQTFDEYSYDYGFESDRYELDGYD